MVTNKQIIYPQGLLKYPTYYTMGRIRDCGRPHKIEVMKRGGAWVIDIDDYEVIQAGHRLYLNPKDCLVIDIKDHKSLELPLEDIRVIRITYLEPHYL